MKTRCRKIGLPMYVACAPLDHALLMEAIVAGLHESGWTEPVELVENPPDLQAFWRDPDLLLGQTCGYPLTTALAPHVRLIGTPCYDFAGCDAHRYRSFIVVKNDSSAHTLEDLRARRAAFNQPDSHSGMNALRHAVAPLARQGRFFSAVVESGSHRASLALVADGTVDAAAVDCVTFGYFALHAPELLTGLRILQPTVAMPGLPLIASKGLDDAGAALLRRVLRQVLAGEAATRLRLTGLVATSLEDYLPVVEARRFAQDRLYPVLA
jgi:ABC-type phosphate/phosphonate transport system substrate-binding protein